MSLNTVIWDACFGGWRTNIYLGGAEAMGNLGIVIVKTWSLQNFLGWAESFAVFAGGQAWSAVAVASGRAER